MQDSKRYERWKSILSTVGDEKGGIITAVEFDESGDNLAVGDKSGHVSLFQKEENSYSLGFRFKSHSPTLDPLKSLEIEERINMIKFVRGRSSGMYVLTTNDKVIKLWRVQKRRSKMLRRLSQSPTKMKEALRMNSPGNTPVGSPISSTRPGLPVPPPNLSIKRLDRSVSTGLGLGDEKDVERKKPVEMVSTLKRQYGGAHTYHIHSISINSDNETFISLDSLRVNLWHLQRDAQRFPIIDIKPKDMASLTEIVTSGTFHPDHCHTLMYTTSRGRMCFHDLRSSAILKEPAKNFEIPETAYLTKHFFSEVLTSISDAKFTADGRYVLSRDYLSLKLWDVNMEKKPVEVFPVQPQLADHLPILYQNNALFDRFQCAPSPDGTAFATGSYSNRTIIQGKSTPAVALTAPVPTGFLSKTSEFKMTPAIPGPSITQTRFNEKVLLCAWHPKQPIVAVSGFTGLDVYEQTSGSTMDDPSPGLALRRSKTVF